MIELNSLRKIDWSKFNENWTIDIFSHLSLSLVKIDDRWVIFFAKKKTNPNK